MSTAEEESASVVLPEGLRRGRPGYVTALVALVAAGLASFNTMYCTQALMPTLTDALGASAADASLTVSAATGVLALTILPASVLSERFGRGRVIVGSAAAAVAVGLLLPFAPSLSWLVVGRGVQGLMVAGVPATAMAWLSQEIDPHYLPQAMGLYVAGNTVGGLLGRLIPAGMLNFTGWRWALAVDMLFALACTVVTVFIMPKERRFVPKAIGLRTEMQAVLNHWYDSRKASLFLVAFLAMGTFVSLYDFLGYRLTTAPFHFSQSGVGGIFLLYLFGTVASARTGTVVTRWGRSRTILGGAVLGLVGLPMVISTRLSVILIGVAVFTYGFFIVHSVASGWVGALANKDRAEASGTYLACYYLGSSIVGYLSGLVFHHFGWRTLTLWMEGTFILSTILVVTVARRSATH
ncbi:MFS transporter [Cutibacterium sp. WCA-380-WT-3A]|uniref:MFS transporter n=1 Tax=Cutibacterium porci TaxID=2605781 RepID=A0A7K0J432_9ACTN|nr:MFS transporter [Cutibacterium porci]MSS44695.1 MFS transporter [Cutibacterium porci]